MSEPKRRKVDSENRTFQFHWTEEYFFILPNSKNAKPTCLICNETVAVNKAANLKRHYHSKHAAKYDRDYPKGSLRNEKIVSLQNSYEKSNLIMKRALTEQEKCAETSLRISWIMAKNMIPYSHSEVIKLCLLEAANTLFENKKEVSETFNKIPLSRQTVTAKIETCSTSVKENILHDLLKAKFFSLAIDESIDISDISQMAVYVRYLWNSEFKEELLTLLPLYDRTTGEILFKNFQKFMESNNLLFDNILSITTDGAPAMTGKVNGFIAFMKNLNSKIIALHCIIHQSVLCAKLSDSFKNVMALVIKIVNYLRSHSALQHRLLRAFLQESESEYIDLLLHNDVRWLSKGNTLNRLICLLPEIRSFLESKNTKTANEYFQFLSNIENVGKICFLGDVFSHFNELKKHLQGRNKVLCDMWEIIKAFQRKLQLFENDLNSKELLHFPLLKDHIEKNPDEDIGMDTFVKFLQKVQIEFSSRFSEFSQLSDLLTALKNPFSMEPNGNWVTQAMHLVSDYVDKARLQLEIIELQESSVLKKSYQATQITKFWTDTLPDETYPNLRKIGSCVLTMFGSTYVCEAAFSKMNYVKSKFRNRLTDRHLEDCLIAATTSYNPEFTKIVKDSKSQFSH